MLKKIRLRNKLEIIGAITIVAILITVSAVATTRTITDSADNLYTFIRNSNGGYWEATGANIQTAIDDLTTGGTIWLPSGIITVTDEIGLDDNITLAGQGEGKTILRGSLDGSKSFIWIYHDDHVTLRDFTIDMNDNGGNGIYVGDADFTTIDHVEILNAGYQGIYIAPYGTTQSLFTNIRVKHSLGEAGHGIGVNNANNSIFSNIIVENYDKDVDASEDGLDITDCFNSTFNNIIIQGCGWLDGMKLSASESELCNCTFSNIIISDVYGYAMKIQFLSHCNFDNIVTRDTGYLSISNTAHHCNFNNIMTSNSDGLGFYSEGHHMNFNNILLIDSIGGTTFNGNNFTINNLQILNPGSYNLVSGNDFTISNSKFADGSSYGLNIQNSNRFQIIGCEFLNNAGDGIDTTVSSASNYSIVNCIFKGNAQGIDCNANDDYIIITQNIFIDDTLDDHYLTKGYVANNIGDDI